MTKMPDPVAYLFSVGPYRYASVDDAPQHELPSQCVKHGLLTTTQAEAYKDACVREALDAYDANPGNLYARDCFYGNVDSDAIRALLAERDALRHALETMVEMVEMNGFGRAYAMDVARAALAQDQGGSDG